MKDIQINNINKLYENRAIRSSALLLNFYIENVDAWNAGKFCKDDLARKFNVSRRTVSNWIRALSDAGVIKYKYSGSARLNPKIYFSGSEEDYKKALDEFSKFRADL